MKPFVGNGYRIAVPDDWVDLSVYAFRGPAEDDFAHALAVSTDAVVPEKSARDYARRHLRVARQSMPGAEVLIESQVAMGRLQAYRAEVRWYPAEGIRRYQRTLHVLDQGAGFYLAATCTKKSRVTQGPTIDRMMATFRPGRAPGPGDPPEGSTVFRADRFSLWLHPGWSDETIVTLAQPDASRFRRTLAVMRSPLEARPGSIAAAGKVGIEKLKAQAPGFALVEEGELPLRGGDPGYRARFTRATAKGATVAQEQLVAFRDGHLFTLTLTTEPEPPSRKQRVLAEIIPSFEAYANG